MSSHFIGNLGTTNGGSLCISTNNVKVVECNFENIICDDLIGDVNRSFSKGGALFFEKFWSNSLSNCYFTANKASMAGGAIYIEYNKETKIRLSEISMVFKMLIFLFYLKMISYIISTSR